ncbi:splicing factor SF3a60 homolog isoform X2 [Amborella trichopoda]|uniref:splicing factor SF3a60 homolog isoform X2 n=1 Tax=Amborella trichopoda TaxID=13333 RepID=UPI0009BDF2B5|nr:splicing factor SF3a60 homolog isoform X2 [Amborella trichopoda]|eukprot:XP_020527853.1 splicing factor SF3a60 homolog isoform X2 [Amborella trichopoda]
MSSTVLERTRCAHEEIERLERLAVKDLQHEPSTTRERLFQNHRVRGFVDNIIHTTDELIREYHRKFPVARVVEAPDDEESLKEEPYIEFSGEEAFGRYLDMHGLYNEYINSKFGEKIEYSAYLDVFPQTHKIPLNLKLTRQYREYLDHVLDYLTSFFQRTEPLQDVDRIFSKVEAEFEERWADGNVHGWEGKGLENGNSTNQGAIIDLDYYDNADELVSLGPKKLKEALAALSLKSGGTVQQRAERLFLTKHTPLEKLDRKHFAKGSTHVIEQNNAATHSQHISTCKDMALTEVKMQRLCELLDETIVRTKENVEKKQALTYEEMEAEREEEEVQAESESDEDEQQIYNPLKLPMGWDGKPIPYWLYKLHGLGQEFKCEICGNHSYWGRRAFERHFKEWRHQHGMRCLGIPNTKNFNEITSIKEAKVLWEKIQERQGVNKWRPELEEEYEDKDGNIYNKKTFTDLRRQGLI